MGTINKYLFKQLVLQSYHATTPTHQQSTGAKRDLSHFPLLTIELLPCLSAGSSDYTATMDNESMNWAPSLCSHSRGKASRRSTSPRAELRGTSSSLPLYQMTCNRFVDITGGSSFGLSLTQNYTKFPEVTGFKL